MQPSPLSPSSPLQEICEHDHLPSTIHAHAQATTFVLWPGRYSLSCPVSLHRRPSVTIKSKTGDPRDVVITYAHPSMFELAGSGLSLSGVSLHGPAPLIIANTSSVHISHCRIEVKATNLGPEHGAWQRRGESAVILLGSQLRMVHSVAVGVDPCSLLSSKRSQADIHDNSVVNFDAICSSFETLCNCVLCSNYLFHTVGSSELDRLDPSRRPTLAPRTDLDILAERESLNFMGMRHSTSQYGRDIARMWGTSLQPPQPTLVL